MDTRIQSRSQDDRILTGAGVAVPAEGEKAATGPSGKAVAPILAGDSVTVTSPTDLQTLMEKLRLDSNNKREDLVRGRLQTSLAAALESIRAVSSRDAETVQKIEDNCKQIEREDQIISRADAALKGLPSAAGLEIKIKELEAAIERAKKTPEESQKDYERKQERLQESDLAAQERAGLKTESDLEAQEKAAEQETEDAGNEKKIKDLEENLARARQTYGTVKNYETQKAAAQAEKTRLHEQNRVLHADLSASTLMTINALLAEVVKEGPQIETAEDRDEKKGRTPISGMDAFMRVFSGDELRDVIEEKRERNV